MDGVSTVEEELVKVLTKLIKTSIDEIGIQLIKDGQADVVTALVLKTSERKP